MSPEAIAAIFAGLVALIGAISTITAGRSRRRGDELRELQREARELRAQQRLSDQYLGRLLRLLDLHGIPVPRPPEGLFDDVVQPGLPAPADVDDAAAHDRTGRRRRPSA